MLIDTAAQGSLYSGTIYPGSRLVLLLSGLWDLILTRSWASDEGQQLGFRKAVALAAASISGSAFMTMCRSVRTIAMTAMELHRGSSSTFAAYFAHVPTKFDSLSHWSDEELQELQDPDLFAQVLICWMPC